MPFNWGLGGDVASIGLPQSKASPPMLISQGHEAPLQHFSFEGGWKIQQQEPCRGTKKKEHIILYHYIYQIIEASYRGVLGPNNKRQTCQLNVSS